MGMYDEITGDCPTCGKEFYVQTKLTDCTMALYRVGDKIHLDDMKLGLKNKCECGAFITAHIKDCKLVRFSSEDHDAVEGLFGSLYEKRDEAEQKEKA